MNSIKSKNLGLIGLVLALLAAIFTAFYKTGDNIVVKHFTAMGSDKITAVLAYLVIGSWVGLITGVVLALCLGKKILDPTFKGIIFLNRSLHLISFFAGSFATISTFFIFGDVNMVIQALLSLLAME